MGIGGVEGLGAALTHVVFDDARKQDECQKPHNYSGNDGDEVGGEDGSDPLEHGGERIRGHGACGDRSRGVNCGGEFKKQTIGH